MIQNDKSSIILFKNKFTDELIMLSNKLCTTIVYYAYTNNILS